MTGPSEDALARTAQYAVLFPDKLRQLLREREMTPSDLARSLFGETVDAKGANVAKNRDTVSRWINGHHTPNEANLRRIAGVLDVPVQELAPVETTSRRSAQSAEMMCVQVSESPLLMQVRLNMVLPATDALKLLAFAQKFKGDTSDRDAEPGRSSHRRGGR